MSELDLPQLNDLVAASFAVGALFLVRFVLGVRRILVERNAPHGVSLQALRDTTRPLGHGREFEPNRRHAMRQLSVGLFLLALGLLLLVWLGVSSALA